MSRIWATCLGDRDLVFSHLGGSLLRMVESQEQVATSAIVDSAAEQQALEELLEAAKPPAPPGSEMLHYLLKTPFRYPPLRHGSRFGSRFERAIFYGARLERTVLAEAAYYRFWFWSGMTVPPADALITQHTVFRAAFDTHRGVRLQLGPFDRCVERLRSPDDYTDTQAFGAELRGAAVMAFEYLSARDAEAGLAVAIFEPAVFAPGDRVLGQSEWTCTTSAARVMFFNLARREPVEFPLEQFMAGGRLPDPAA